jgi:hypothetical protein
MILTWRTSSQLRYRYLLQSSQNITFLGAKQTATIQGYTTDIYWKEYGSSDAENRNTEVILTSYFC